MIIGYSARERESPRNDGEKVEVLDRLFIDNQHSSLNEAGGQHMVYEEDPGPHDRLTHNYGCIPLHVKCTHRACTPNEHEALMCCHTLVT